MNLIKNKGKAVLIMIAFLIAFAGCKAKSEKDYVSEELGINVSSGEVLYFENTHGGFYGDGGTYVSLKFSNEDFLNEIEKSDNWEKLPLTYNLEALVYGISEENVNTGPFLGEEGKNFFPVIENGYYYFEDRQSEGDERFEDKNVLKRSSFNVTVGVFDKEENILYLCVYDT